MSKRMAVLVSNACTKDARVLKSIEVAKKQGFKIKVFCVLDDKSKPFEEIDGVEFQRFKWRPLNFALKQFPFNILSLINKNLAKAAAATIIAYIKYGLYQKLFLSALLEFKPDIIHSHDFICLPLAVKAGAKGNSQVIYDAHELEVHRNPPLPFFRKIFVKLLERSCAKKCAHVITVGDEIGDILQKSFNKDVSVIYNTPVVEPYTRNIREDLNLGDDEQLLIYVGKVTVGRGVEKVIETIKSLDNVTFATIGPCDPKIKDTLYRLAKKNGVVDRFFVLPAVSYRNVVPYISGADLGIISVEPVTLSYELCMPNKLFELIFANVPIISNDLTEVNKIIGSLGNGIITDFDADESLAADIAYALFRSKEFKSSYKVANSRDIIEQYTWSAMEARLISIYQTVLEKYEE